MLHVLMVCTGNTCRSSMAEYLLKNMIARHGYHDRISVGSAGTCAWNGNLASDHAVEVLWGKGIDLRAHRSRCLDAQLLADADIILAMTDRHKRAIVAMAPDVAEKTFSLSEYADDCPPIDIHDPYGGSVDVYRLCLEQLEKTLDKIWPKLAELAGKA